MKVIKCHTAEAYRAYRFKCPVCESELQGTKKEMMTLIFSNEVYYGFVCPACGGSVVVRESDLEPMR